jgi:phosphatidylinositol 4-kinase
MLKVPYMIHVEVVGEHYPGSAVPTAKDETKRSLSLEIHHSGDNSDGEDGKVAGGEESPLRKSWSEISGNVDNIGNQGEGTQRDSLTNRTEESTADEHVPDGDFTVTEDIQRDVQPGERVEEKMKVGEELLDEVFGTSWNLRKEKMRGLSPFGHIENWGMVSLHDRSNVHLDVLSLIVKGGDDLRQEQLAMQIIRLIRDIFEEEGLPLWLNPYMVIVTSLRTYSKPGFGNLKRCGPYWDSS